LKARDGEIAIDVRLSETRIPRKLGCLAGKRELEMVGELSRPRELTGGKAYQNKKIQEAQVSRVTGRKCMRDEQ